MEGKQKERNEKKECNYMESNIRTIRKIKSEESQKRINKLVTYCYVKEAGN